MTEVTTRVQRQQRQRGFTLVELLTLTAIVVLLVATTLPAVQSAREDARMADCKNHLKQLGLAMHNYHDTFKCFPPGWISRRWDGVGHAATGWQTSLLPFMEQAPLYNALRVVAPVYETEQQELLKQNIPFYRCPVAAVGAVNPLRGGWGTSNYSLNYGSNPIPRWSPAFSQSFWPGQSVSPRQGIGEQPAWPNGVGAINSRVAIADMTDGTSNTLMIGERAVLGGAGIWPGPRSNFHENDVVTDASYASPLNRSRQGFSSRHRGVINFVFCDGSVHSLRNDIDSQPEWGVLQKLAARNDHMVVGEF